MGFLTTAGLPNAQKTGTTKVSAPVSTGGGGFLSSAGLPTGTTSAKASANAARDNKIALDRRTADYLNSPTGIAIETLKGVGNTFANVGKGLYNTFTNPSPEQQAFEAKNQITLPPGTPTVQRVLTAPGREVAKVITRFINPGLQPIATDLAEITAISEPGGIADQVAAGKIPPSVLDEFAVLHKTNPQIVGDVAQAVLTAYAGGSAENIVSKGVVKEGLVTGGQVGLTFGAAQAASSGETDPAKIVQTIGLSGLAGGVLGGITSGIIPASSKLVEAVKPAKAAYDLLAESEARAAARGGGFLDTASVPRTLPVTHEPSDYNFYTPPKDLPVIDMGPAAPKGPLPVIDANTNRVISKGAPASRVEPISVPFKAPTPINKTDIAAIPAPTSRIKEIKPVGTGETRLSKLAASVDLRATQEGLGKVSDLPQYKTMNIEEQSVLANRLIEVNPGVAIQIARGERLPPAGLHPEAVFTALENAAIKAGDIQTLRDLASGTLSTQATAMGQRIRLLGERNAESPVRLIRDVQETRQANIETKTGVKYEKAKDVVVSDIKKEIKAAAPKKETWEGFIKSLECGY